MKHKIFLSYACGLLCLASSAAVPLRWTVDMRRAQPATFEAYQGETIDIKAALMLDGKPFEAPSNYSFFWQTNGMGRYYWEAPCSRGGDIPVAATNVLFATWLPAYDVGAKVYKCFIGSPSNNYHSAFQLRLTPSPGATPNVLPLPVPVIDFAKVRVLNPPWEGGGGGGVNTNAVIDIIHETVSGSARSLPKYLHERYFDDSYPEAAEEYYRSRGNGKTDGGCSAVRSGGYLSRNFDFPFDDRAEFVVKMSAGPNRFASVGVAQVGTNLTEQMVTSGKPEYSHFYKWLPGATVDGINENGVACNINVVDGDPQTSGWYGTTIPDPIHPLAAIRWILDNATNAQQAATYIASHIRFPAGWTQNFHYMIADATSTYIVENGSAFPWEQYLPAVNPVLTNYQLLGGEPGTGEGRERANLLAGGANITNAWYTNAYRRETNPPWVSDLKDVLAYTNEIFNAWASHPKEYFRNSSLIPHHTSLTWWQTVHTSVYDITNRVLRVAVQETDDWYVFQVPSAGGGIKEETDPTATAKANAAIEAAGCVRTNDNGNAEVNSLTALIGGLSAFGNDGYVGTFFGTYFISAFGEYYLPWQQKFPKGTDPNREFAVLADIPDVSGFVPYTGAEYPVYLGNNDLSTSGNIQGEYVYADFAFGCNYTQYRDGLIHCPDGNEYFLPGNVEYGKYPMFDFALRSQIEDATNGLVSAENPAFAAEVLKVQVTSLSTNITAEVYAAATNACANLGIDPALIPGEGTVGTVGGFIAILFVVVFWMKRKIFDNGGKVTDDFVTECLGKPVAKAKLQTIEDEPTVTSGAVTLKDGAASTVAIGSLASLDITFDEARNGGLRLCELYITGVTAGTIPDLTFDAETVSFVATGDSFPACEAGINYFVFAEVAENLWKVTRETLKSITTPTPVAA